MNYVIDVKGNLNKGDILVFDGKTLKPMKKTVFLSSLHKENSNLNNLISDLEKRLKKAELELAYNRGDLTEEEYENGLAGIE